MKKFYMLLMAAGLAAASAATVAAQGYKSAVVEKTDGTTTLINLDQSMTTQFEGDMLTFTGANTSVEIPKSDLVAISFSELSGINEVNAAPTMADGCLTFTGLPEGSTIAVFDTAGRCLSSSVAEGGDKCLPLNNLTTGVYIVRVNGFSYKISVK